LPQPVSAHAVSAKSTANKGLHDWKHIEPEMPRIVQQILGNGLRNPLGFLVMFGIFYLPLWIYLNQFSQLFLQQVLEIVPILMPVFGIFCHEYMLYVLIFGRALGLYSEFYFMKSHVQYMIAVDQHNRN
jgi:hypothetical protein